MFKVLMMFLRHNSTGSLTNTDTIKLISITVKAGLVILYPKKPEILSVVKQDLLFDSHFFTQHSEMIIVTIFTTSFLN